MGEIRLLLGNGFLGAMVCGAPALERAQLNLQNLWSGGPDRDNIMPRPP